MTVQKISTTNVSTVAKDQTFILDTNILYFIHSGYYSSCDPKNIAYSNFVQKLITNGNQLIISVTTIQELFYGIENKEYQLYCSKNKPNAFTKKDFRADGSLRKAVQNKLQVILVELKNSYNLSECTITPSQVEDFLDKYDNHRYDPIDFIIVNNMIEKSYVNFITDDSDFTYDSNINVFTLWFIHYEIRY